MGSLMSGWDSPVPDRESGKYSWQSWLFNLCHDTLMELSGFFFFFGYLIWLVYVTRGSSFSEIPKE
jgi:hypothetical protein